MKKAGLILAFLAAGACAIGPFWPAAGQLARIRMLMVVVSAGVFLITLLAIRSYKLQEKYAGLWLATVGMLLLAAFFPQVMGLAHRELGMSYPAAVVAVVIVFLVLVAFHFSIALSAVNDKLSATASRVAILEARIRELERRNGPAPHAPKDGPDEPAAAPGR